MTMKRVVPAIILSLWLLPVLGAVAAIPAANRAAPADLDARNIRTGMMIRDWGYSDQPFVVIAKDGSWICSITTCATREGDAGQTITVCRSEDKGRTWTDFKNLEPDSGPVASWALPFISSTGRIYIFYTYNVDGLTNMITEPGSEKHASRVDTLGAMMFRFSDDNGRTWSLNRYRVPIRNFDIDRRNPYGGRIQYWWGVGKPILHQGNAYIGFAKVGSFGEGFMAESEGAFICSTNLNTELDPEKLHWITLPDGDVGLRPAAGKIGDEHNLVGLSDGSLFCTYRTVAGHPCHAYSRDGGHTWTPPAFMNYGPGKRLVKHPRAANFVKKFGNGKFLYWFHNNGLANYNSPGNANRNPAWVLGGIENDGMIHWSEPEILLYDEDSTEGISYPDFIEDDGQIYVTETQKTAARVHIINPRILAGVWGELKPLSRSADRQVLELENCTGQTATIPAWPSFDKREQHREPSEPRFSKRGSISVALSVKFDSVAAGQILLDSRGTNSQGITLVTTDRGTVKITLCDRRIQTAWECDAGLLKAGQWHQIVAIVDGGSKVISFVVDGQFCDGGTERDFGWGSLHRDFRQIEDSGTLQIGPGFKGEIGKLRLYHRALLTAEAVQFCREAAAEIR
ncbi:MAG TPA: LamG-like jellyroll fold domain-containing protein [Verrucomicrobiae bacterium]|nr:LamG-like jellyroll fold domain-containing protein [Verrucomicrobiae bacterium]